MHIFHKWSKWSQYKVESFKYKDGKKIVVGVEMRQVRRCKICNKVQDESVSLVC